MKKVENNSGDFEGNIFLKQYLYVWMCISILIKC